MNADELKKADEIVRALRDYASDCDDDEACCQCTFAWICDKCGGNAPKIIADLIESLTAQLASVTAERDAAVEDLRKNRARKCDCCAYAGRSERWPCVDCQSSISNYGDGWKWRGPQKGE